MLVGVLGPVVIVDGGRVTEVDVAKHRALLSVLAVHGGRPVAASELIDAIWGERPPATAPKTLQGYVSALRRSFGAGLIATEPGGYRLGDDVDDIDVVQFERAIEAGRDHLEDGRADRAVLAFRRALGQWRGRPLLDVGDGSWGEGQIARLDELLALAHEGEIEAELEAGHHRDVIPELELLVHQYPYREHVWRLLMLALYRAGRIGASLEAFDRVRSLLDEELGVEPASATVDLRSRIIARDAELDAPTPRPPTNVTAYLDRFVGRDRELRELVDAIRHHRLVALIGIGGVGKSRLANEASRQLRDEFAGGVWWLDLAAADAAASLTTLAASAMSLRPGRRVDAAVVATLRRAPALLVLDNCEHRVDDVAAFATWVTTRVDTVRLVATSRVRLEVPGCRNLTVEPLSTTEDGEAVELLIDRIADRGGRGVRHDDAVRLAELVGGIPLGVELAAAQCVTIDADDLIRRLHQPDLLLSMTDDAHDDRQASLGRVLDAGLVTLDEDTRRLIRRLAVLPTEFDLALARSVMDADRPTAEQAIRAAITALVVMRAPSVNGIDRYRVLWPIRVHLARQLAIQDRDAAVARHATYFVRFAARYRVVADTEHEVAWVERAIADDAGLRSALAWCELHDGEGAVVLATALARTGWQRGDQQVAASDLERALGMAPDAAPEVVTWGVEAVCWPEFLAGRIDSALRHSDEATERFELAGDARGLARALRTRAHALHLAGFDVETTTPIYRRAIDVAEDARSAYAVALGQVQLAHSLAAWERHDLDDVEALLDAADAVLRDVGDRAVRAHAELSRVFLAFGRNDIEGARVAGEEMMRISRLDRAVAWQQIAATALGVNAFERGDGEAHRRCFSDAIRWAVETDNEVQLGIALWSLAATIGPVDAVHAAQLWGAASVRSPLWPLHRRRYEPWIDAARAELGDRFEPLCETGARLTTDEVVAVCSSAGFG